MNHEQLEKQKIRIIEVDRKLAAQLADVWEDMKLRIEKTMEPVKKQLKPSKLRNEIKQKHDQD
jgi:hypothetical protein